MNSFEMLKINDMRCSSLMKKYIVIVVVLTAFLGYVVLYFNYQTYYQVMALVSHIDNNYYLTVANPIKYKYLKNDSYLIIDDKKYSYKINKIEEELQVIDDENYQLVYLEVNLDDNYCIENLLISIKIPNENKPLIKYLLN